MVVLSVTYKLDVGGLNLPELQLEAHIDLHVTIESAHDHSSTDDTVCGLKIPNKLLYLWYCNRTAGCQLIKALNGAILHHCFVVREDCQRVSERLRAEYMALASNYHAAVSDRKRLSLLENAYIINIMPGKSVLVQDYVTLTEDFERGFEKETDKLYEQVTSLLLSEMSCEPNREKPVDELSPRQARRKIGEFQDKVEAVLWFAESYGLEPTVLHLETATSHQPVELSLTNEVPATWRETCNLLCPTNETHLSCLHYVFVPRINAQLKVFMQAWNNHSMRTEH